MKLIFIISLFVLIAAFSNADNLTNENITILADSVAKCPVTGDEITTNLLIFRYIDKDVKFCNEACIMAFKKNPSKFSNELKCMPCNDDDANPKIHSTHNGVKYYFCGEGCKRKFEKDPDTYLDKFLK